MTMTPGKFSSRLHLPLLLISCITMLISACTTLPGDGGTSEITGKVYVNEYNVSGILFNSYYGAEVRVYIIYGDETSYDDEVKTNYDGTYKFPFLRKGKYQVYAYSDCISCDGGTAPVIQEIEITDNNASITVPDLVVDKR